MQRICSTLSKAGYEVTLIGFLRKNSIELEAQDYDQKRVQLFFIRGKLLYLEYNLKLFIHFLSSKYDVHTAIDLDTVLASYLTSLLKPKRKLLIDVHELYTGLPEVERRPSVLKWWTRLESWIYPKIERGYTVNESLAQHYKNTYGLELDVIRNLPKSKELKKDVPRSEKPILIYQGWLNEGRGLEALISSMKNIDAELWLVGEGELSIELRNLAEKEKVEDKVIFKGFIKPAELHKYTAQAYIGLNLLESRSKNYFYSLANKFFDYVQAGIPQITMAYPEYKLLNDKHEVAYLIENVEVKTVTEAVNSLLKDETIYKRLQENSKRARSLWTWENESKKLLEFYRNHT